MCTTAKKRFLTIAAILVCFAAILACGLQAARSAQAANGSLTRHALPTDEPSLVMNSNELTGENWMSGISGAFFLHEINIPGAHDACMWNVFTTGTIAKTQKKYAKTQSMSIEDQLKAGVRFFDIRLTNKGPYLEDGPFAVHGPNKGWLGDYRFFNNAGKGSLSFETLLTWYSKFLREHPTETIILDLQYESESGDGAKTLALAREKLDKYYTEKNPSTGKPYVYTENGNKAVSTIPQLSDCRGQMVVMSCDDLQYGMRYGSSKNWDPKTIGGVHFAVENHYEAEKVLKWEYTEAMLYGGSAGKDRYNDPLAGGTKGATLKLNLSAAAAPLDHGIVASTGSNRAPVVTSDPHQDPKEIADYINPLMYVGPGYLANTGTFCGWIMSDFVTNDTVKTYWKTNFPSDLQYMTVTYAAPDATGGLSATRNVLAGSEITLPRDPFPDSTAKKDFTRNYNFVGWTIDGKNYDPGATVTISSDTRITARVTMNWESFQYRLEHQDDGATYKMDMDVVGSPADIPLHIPAGKTLTINMNGHTIDRASKPYGYSRAFTVDGNLTLTGAGTVKGGYDKNGAGLLVNGTLTTNNVTIEDNRAGRWGGGVYIGSGASFTMNGGSITKNIAEHGGGVCVGQSATFSMKGGSITGNNAMVGGAVSALNEGSTVKVSDNVNMTANYLIPNDKVISVDTNLVTSGDVQNVRLDSRNYITVEGALDAGARIGVTKASSTGGGPQRVAYRSDGIDPILQNQNLSSDQANRQIIKYDDNFAAISDGVTVSFDTDGGSAAPESQTVGIGGTATKPVDPTKSKYTFDYWYKSNDASQTEFNFSTAITENTTLKAKWKPVKQTVTFISNGGSPVEQKSVDYGSQVTQPSNPTKEGAQFKEWMIKVPLYGYTGQWTFQAYDFNRPVRNNIELFARWTSDTHTVTFNVDGGTAIPQASVTYGGVVTRPTNPTKNGFAFGGWFTDATFSNAYNFSTPVKADTILYAKWIPTHFTVVFESNGGSPVSAQSVASGSAASEPANPTRAGYDFSGWFVSNAYAGSSYDFSTPITKDTTLYAQWSAMVTFDSNGGSTVEPQKVAMGVQAKRPTDPTREGYTFSGWYTEDNNLYNFETPIDAPLTLKAHWTQKVDNKHFVLFDSNGGSTVASQEITEGNTASTPSPAPTKANSEFVGWYTDPALTNAYDFSSPVNDDLYLYAKWNVNKHTVSFNVDGGSPAISDQQVDHGSLAPVPNEPAKDAYLFAGWFKNSECTVPYNFSSPVASDLALHAKWVKIRYDVVFEPNGGSAVAPQSVESKEKASVPDPAPTRDGCTFAGWYTDETLTTQYDFNTPVNGDLCLYAKWTATVQFETGTSSSIAEQTVPCGQQAAKPANPAKDGNNFEGWFVKSPTTYSTTELAALKNAIATNPSIDDYYWIVGDEVRLTYDFDAPVDYGITLHARWTPTTHTITFDTDGGDPVASISGITDGQKVTAPAAPTKTGFVFGGWFLDATCEHPFDFSEAIVDDLTLHAKWTTRDYTVQFDTNCSESVPNQTVTHGGTVNEPDPIKNDGFYFGGWYTDPNLTTPFNFATPVTADMVLYARWSVKEPASAYTVNFVDEDSPESEPADTQSVIPGGTATRPEPDPTNEYATFAGWYIELEDGLSETDIAEIENDPELAATVWVVGTNARVLYDFDMPVDENITLYARWDYGDCLVTYIDEGSELYADVVKKGGVAENYELDGIYGYTFDGWFADEALSQPYDFSTPVTGDLTLYAKLTQNRYTVTFNSNGGSEVAPQSVAYEELANVPEGPVWAGHTFMGWYEGLGAALSAQEISEIEEIAEAYGVDYTGLLWQKDDTTLMKYDLENDPIYYDLDLQARWEEGTFTYETVIEDGAPNVTILNSADAALSVLSEEELAKGAHVRFVIRPLTEQEASSDDAKAVDKRAQELGASNNLKFDISVYKRVEGSSEEIAVHELPVPAQLSIEVPDSLKASGRTYYLLRAHEGEATHIAEGTQSTLTGSSDRFSTYGIAAKDAAKNPSAAKNSPMPRTGDGSFTTIILTVLGMGLALAAIVATRTYVKKRR